MDTTKEVRKKHLKRKNKGLWLNKPKKQRRVSSIANIEDDVATSSQNNATAAVTVSTPRNVESELQPSTNELIKAPYKFVTKRRNIHRRKKIFLASNGENILNEIIKIIPTVLNKLQKEGLRADFCLLLRTISSGQFPLHNISFRLLLDVARWYSLDNTTQMVYPNESLRFWKVVYRLFHGKVLRFMAGMKSIGQVIEGSASRGIYSPDQTSINFAVPNINTINNFDAVETGIPREIPSGIIEGAVKFMPREKSYVLSVDGKKLAPGLSANYGDQDLFGHEKGDKLQDLKNRIEDELRQVDCVRTGFSSMDTGQQTEGIEIIIKIVTLRIKDLRLLYQRQKLALKKFHKEAGEDWRNSRFVFAISSVQSTIFQIKSLVNRLLIVNNSLLDIGSRIVNCSQSFEGGHLIDMYSQDNWISLKDPSDMPPNFDETRFIKQRSDKWFDTRQKFRITGSRIYEGIGLDSLKKLQMHFDKVVKKKKIQENISEEARKRMEHGTISEVHAIATLVTKVLPFYYPSYAYVEEGSFDIKHEDKPFILVSPDGSICAKPTNMSEIPVPVLGCEFKCPSPNDYTTPVHYDIPLRYVPQILSEMACMGVEKLLYLSWTEQSSTVFLASYDNNLWEMIYNEAVTLYGADNPKRPTRSTANSKEIIDKMRSYIKNSTELLCEIPSAKATKLAISQTSENIPYVFPIPMKQATSLLADDDDIHVILSETTSALKESYQLCRKKATEILVWLLSDTDRVWNPEIPHSLPIGYAMKGYSLSTTIMRKMHSDILQKCYDNGINVTCSCFDGQWIRLATRDEKDKPLTLLQLQKDVWDKARKVSRENIITSMASVPIVKNLEGDIKMYKTESGSLCVSCPLYQKLTNCLRRKVDQSQSSSQLDENLASVSSVDVLSSLPNDALDILIENDEVTTRLVIPDNTDSTNLNQNTSVQIDRNDPDQQTNDHAEINSNESNGIRKDVISDEQYQEMLDKFKTSNKTNTRKRWENKSLEDIKLTINSIESLQKLTHDEMNAIIESTIDQQKTSGNMILKSWNLREKANGISKFIGSGEQIESDVRVKHMMSLKEIAARKVKTSSKLKGKHLPKHQLNLVYATLIYPDEHKTWIKDSPFTNELQLDDIGSTELFSYPGYSDNRKKLEPMCVDAHHLLVNLRVKVCKDGLKGIKKEAWHKVAEEDRNIISKGLVVDLIDKQNNAFAQRTFSNQVEGKMRQLGYTNEAHFCEIVREWYQAEDSPGISAKERACRRLRMKSFLLRGVDFGHFPPYGMYINGFTRVSFEGFLQKIDTNIQLYALTETGTYNQRAVSSLANETFFGELSEMETTRLGCPKAVNVPRLMSTVTEIMHYRCNPSERTFSITSTRKSVYPVPSLLNSAVHTEGPTKALEQEMINTEQLCSVNFKNHYFDTTERSRKKQRQSKIQDISKPHETSRGCLPVRQHHKMDESKILPTTRLGIDLEDI